MQLYRVLLPEGTNVSKDYYAKGGYFGWNDEPNVYSKELDAHNAANTTGGKVVEYGSEMPIYVRKYARLIKECIMPSIQRELRHREEFLPTEDGDNDVIYQIDVFDAILEEQLVKRTLPQATLDELERLTHLMAATEANYLIVG